MESWGRWKVDRTPRHPVNLTISLVILKRYEEDISDSQTYVGKPPPAALLLFLHSDEQLGTIQPSIA